MREITSHHTNECNRQIAITADERTHGNASHVYDVDVGAVPKRLQLEFQNGPIGEVGVNGITNEALLAILIDRVEGFQSGPYSCKENAAGLECLRQAAEWFESRTKARTARGVEGTHAV